jgi:DNA recombination protein RmuC
MQAALVIAIVGSVIAALVGAGFFILLRMVRSITSRPQPMAQEMAEFYSSMGSVKKALDGIETDQKTLAKSLLDTQRVLDNIKTDYEARRRTDEATRESIKRLEHIIAGTKSKGIAGENFLREIFKLLPPEMIVSNFKIRGKEVEFGMLLANKKVVPIDSKWVATDILASMADEKEEAKREALAQAIEKEISKRINEVAQYIDPSVTSSLAIAAIPDAAYAVCRSAHVSAYRRGVVLIPYSMVVPYLLIFFNLNLQISSTMDIDNLQQYLLDIKRILDMMDDTLEHKIIKAKTMIENAAGDYRLALSSVRSSIKQIESSKGPKTLPDTSADTASVETAITPPT